ncbi:MAG TPA: ATP-binding cassette domain-containing protein [Polyangiaceae bacterium]|nr:ATP-binding cassette domain-containing protein [Polyangiaceae bacterium]
MNRAASPILELSGVSKRWEGVAALHPTSLAVEAGRTTVLIGPSGCGKTTLLRLMLGLLEPDSGEVLFRGEPLTPAAFLFARRRMGYVVQDGGLFPHLSALDNVTLMARYLKWDRARISERVTELAALVQLGEAALGRYPTELSGGQQQRVALMRALMLDPELLFLDEPFGALDPLVRADLQDDLASIFAKLEKSVLLVTHDLAEAALFAHTIVLLDQGRIVQTGSLADLLERPAEPFVTRFVRAQRHFDTSSRAPEVP